MDEYKDDEHLITNVPTSPPKNYINEDGKYE
jgi:hypothetical protein